MNNQTHRELYDRDFYLWIDQSVALLKAGNLQELDLENLVEEIESMGRSEKRSVISNLEVILLHLLKYKYQPDKRSNSWRFTLIEHRRRIATELEDSPSLKSYLLEKFIKSYEGSRKLASIETEIPIDTFPGVCPFTPDQALDEDYYPQ